MERLLRICGGQLGRQDGAVGQGLDALAPAVEEQPPEVDTGPTRGLGLREIGREADGVLAPAHRRIKIGSEGLHDPLEG